jgi:hypothetical protein
LTRNLRKNKHRIYTVIDRSTKSSKKKNIRHENIMAFYGKIRAKEGKFLSDSEISKIFSSFGWKALVTNQEKVTVNLV